MATRNALDNCDTLSKVIRLGIGDGRLMNEDPEFGPEASVWCAMGYTLTNKRACLACFAGAVMRGTLGVTSAKIRTGRLRLPGDFDEESRRKLIALEYARAGRYSVAIATITQIAIPHGEKRRLERLVPKSKYREFNDRKSFAKFLDSMENIASILEELGY